jgi:hypothetical protein
MRNPTRTALRWGAPLALAAAAIAALLVVPALGGTANTLKDRINATQLTVCCERTITPDKHRVGSLNLNSGNYVVTATYDVHRKPDQRVACTLKLLDETGVQSAQTNLLFGPFMNQASLDNVWQGGSLSATAHVGAGAKARLGCASVLGYASVKPGAEITALRVPKVTQKYLQP